MGSSGTRVLLLVLFFLSARTVSAQSASQLDILCRPPAPVAVHAGNKAERDAQLRRAAQDFDEDRYVESLTALHAAYAVAPGADILFNMGQACLAANRHEEAFALYSRAQLESTSPELTATITGRLEQLRPRLAKTLTLKAILLGSQGRHAEACAVWSRAYELDAKPLYLLQLADALRQANRSEEALVLYERLGNLPNAPEISEVARRRIAELRQPVVPHVTPDAVAITPSQSAPAAPIDNAPAPQKRVPITRKWWFWTALIGATAAVGLAVGLGTKAALDRPSYFDLRQISF